MRADGERRKQAEAVARRLMTEVLISAEGWRWLVCVHNLLGAQQRLLKLRIFIADISRETCRRTSSDLVRDAYVLLQEVDQEACPVLWGSVIDDREINGERRDLPRAFKPGAEIRIVAAASPYQACGKDFARCRDLDDRHIGETLPRRLDHHPRHVADDDPASDRLGEAVPRDGITMAMGAPCECKLSGTDTTLEGCMVDRVVLLPDRRGACHQPTGKHELRRSLQLSPCQLEKGVLSRAAGTDHKNETTRHRQMIRRPPRQT